MGEYHDKPPATLRSLINEQAQLMAVMGLRGYTPAEIAAMGRAVLEARLARPARPAAVDIGPRPMDWRDIPWSELGASDEPAD